MAPRSSAPALGLAVFLLLPLPSSAQVTSLNVDLTAPPDLPSCKTTKQHLEEHCPLTMALVRFWKRYTGAENSTRRATDGLEAERTALEFLREEYPASEYQVRISNVEEEEAAGCTRKPRLVTFVVTRRGSEWMTRVQVMVSDHKGQWVARER